MPESDAYEWSLHFPFTPRWAGRMILLLRSFPVQVAARSIAILPTVAWIFICGLIPFMLAALCGLKLPTADSTLIWLCIVFPFLLYTIIAVIKINRRLGSHPRQDEGKILAVLDEITVLGWGVTVAVTQLFRPLNRLFTLPLRIIVSSPRAIKWAIFGLILVAAVALVWISLPIKFVPWANQFGRGVVATASVSGFFAIAGIVLLGLLVLIVVFFGFWAEMLVIGGGTAFGAVMLKSVNPDVFSFAADPLIAWARWTPAMATGMLDGTDDLGAYLTGPGGVTPFGLFSMAIVLHWIPLAVKKMNVAIFPGEKALSPGHREELDNRVGWWLRAIATFTFLVTPVFLCVLNRSTSLADPNHPKVENGPFVAVCVLAGVGCLILLRLFKTKRRSVERPNDLVLSMIVYTRRCLRE